jgi:hypothetical protein
MITPTALLAVIKINLLSRPLMHTVTACHCMEIDRQKLDAMIEDGRFPGAGTLA